MDVLGEVKVRVSADLVPLKAQLGGAALAEVQRFDSAAAQAFTRTAQTSALAKNNVVSLTAAMSQSTMAAAKLTAGMTAAGKAAAALKMVDKEFAAIQFGAKGAAEATKLTSFEITNLSYQLNDVASGLVMGQSPFTILAQQGGQFFQIFQRLGIAGTIRTISNAARAAGTALMSFIVTPMGMVAAAATAAAVAIGTVFAVVSSKLPTVDRAIEEHDKAIDSIRAAWKRAADGSEEYRSRAMTSIQFTANQDARMQQSLLRRQLSGALGAGAITGTGLVSQLQQTVLTSQVSIAWTAQQRALREYVPAIQRFLATVRDGKPDIEALNAEIERTANLNPDVAYQKAAQSLRNMTQDATDTVLRLREINEAMNELLINGAFEAAGHKSQPLGISGIQRRFAADMLGINARSPSELQAAARAREEAAPFREDESLRQRQARIDNAGTLARAQAERQLRESMEQRLAGMQKTISAAELELGLIGKTKAEIESQQMAFNLLQAAKEAAAKSNTEVSQAEIQQINEVSAAYGRLQDQIAAARAVSDLLFERAQLALTAAERSVASTLRGLGLTEDSESGRVVSAQVRINDQLKKMVDLLDDIRSASENALSKFIKDMRDGVSIGEAFRGILNSIIDSLIKVGTSQIIKGLLGEQGQAGGGLLGGFVSKLVGGIGAPTEAAGGGVGDILGGIFSQAPTAAKAANENSPVGQQVWDFFSQKGLAAHQVAGIVGNVSTESGFNPAAVGAAGEYGLFQHLGSRKAGLFDFAGTRSPTTQQQLAYAWQEMQGSESRAFGNLRNSSNVLDATKAMAGFERPQGFSWSNPEASMGFTNRYSAAQDAMLEYGDSISETTKTFDTQFSGSLDSLAANTNQTAQGFSTSFQGALQNVVGGIGGKGGGIGGFFSRLFGGGLSQAALAGISGRSGLFAKGGIASEPSIFAEAGTEAAVPLPDGRTIPVTLKPNQKMMQDVRGGGVGDRRPTQNITIQGSTITIKGSVDRQTLAELETRLNERDAQLKDDLARGEIGGVTQRYGSLKG